MNIKHVLRITAVLVLGLLAAMPASAGWTVFKANPTGARTAQVHGGSGTQMMGWIRDVNFEYGPAVWDAVTGDYAFISAPNADVGLFEGASNGQQVGSVLMWDTGQEHAALWNGTAASFLDLNPLGATSSAATGTDGTRQVGYADFNGSYRALLWNGSSSDYTDLGDGLAMGLSGNQQVGFSMANEACLWNGTEASRVNLHDSSGGYLGSSARGTDGAQQGGSYFRMDTVRSDYVYFAALWSGSAESCVMLHPAGFISSEVRGVSGGWQSGYVCNERGDFDQPMKRATVWNGTASSRVDLHSILPAGYAWSNASEIERIGNHIRVYGSAYSYTGVYDAFIWETDVVPEPSSLLALGSGLLALGGLIRRKK